MEFIANPVRVSATRILEVTDVTKHHNDEKQAHPDLVLRLEDGRNFEADSGMTARYVPVPGDYLVTQDDGYDVYVNPKDVFERKYSPDPGAPIRVEAGGVEQAIQAAGANVAPRITPEDIEANIRGEYYFTAANGVVGNVKSDANDNDLACLDLLTFCVLILRNGFTVTGESACASAANFNVEIGRRIARENAVAKVWPLMGYELRTKLTGGAA